MYFKILIFSSALFIFTVIATAQSDTLTEPQYKHLIGLNGGLSTGLGMSYRFLPHKFGVQTTFAPLKEKHRTEITAGIAFLYKLIDARITDLYLYQGNMFVYEKYIGYDYKRTGTFSYSLPKTEREHIKEEIENNLFTHSIGIGIEFILLERVSYNFLAGYAAFENFEAIDLTFETGLFYRF